MPKQQDPRITKRKVTMKGTGFAADGSRFDTETTDYVDEQNGVLDAYVASRRALGFYVEVGDYDAGPGGYDGETYVPHDIDHPQAGTFKAATGEDFHTADPAHPDNDGVSLTNPWATARHLGVPWEHVERDPRALIDHPQVQRRLARADKESGQ